VQADLDCNTDGVLHPVLALMHMHVIGVQSLNLLLNSGWAYYDETWASLGKMTNLTKLQLTFTAGVRSQGWTSSINISASTLIRIALPSMRVDSAIGSFIGFLTCQLEGPSSLS
jgi:hypothetical protein